MKRAYRALANPVLVLVLLLRNLLLLKLPSDLCVLVRGIGGLILNRGLMFIVLVGPELLLLYTALNDGALTLFMDVLVFTRNLKGIVVGPLDIDVLLVNARQLAMELISFLGLPYIKLWCEGADVLELAVDIAEGLAVVLVEKTKRRKMGANSCVNRGKRDIIASVL